MICTPELLTDRPSTTPTRREAATELRHAMQHVLAGVQPTRGHREKRREHRTPYPYLIQLAPVESDGRTPAGDGIVVVGKHLSPGGIDFYHRDPLPHRWMIASLESGGRTQAVLVELLWCRFNKLGWYENGGRFLRLVNSQ